MHSWVLVTLLVIGVAITEGKSEEDVSKLQDSDERVQLLKDHLTIGFYLAQTDVRRNNKLMQVSNELPPEYFIALYNSYLQSRAVNPESADLTNGNVICFPNQQCVEVKSSDEVAQGGSEESEAKDSNEYVKPVAQSRKNVVCFPNGQCIDLDDPGVHPLY